MKRVTLGLMALVIAATACQEIATSPQTADIQVHYRLSNPPPPPIDTGATGLFSPNASTFSISKSASRTPNFTVSVSGVSGPRLDVGPCSFDIPVTYFFNKTENSGFLHFGGNAHGGSVKFQKGDLSGQGTLQADVCGGTLVINLSSLEPGSFLGCSSEVIGAVPQSAAPPDSTGGVCFGLFFSDATFIPTEGPPVAGSVDLFPSFGIGD